MCCIRVRSRLSFSSAGLAACFLVGLVTSSARAQRPGQVPSGIPESAPISGTEPAPVPHNYDPHDHIGVMLPTPFDLDEPVVPVDRELGSPTPVGLRPDPLLSSFWGTPGPLVSTPLPEWPVRVSGGRLDPPPDSLGWPAADVWTCDLQPTLESMGAPIPVPEPGTCAACLLLAGLVRRRG